MVKQGHPAKPGRAAGSLPQNGDIWQADSRQLSGVSVADSPAPPWISVVFSVTQGIVVRVEVTPDRPPQTLIWDLLIAAIEKPDVGTPHLPAEVEFCSDELASVRRGSSNSVSACAVVPELDGVDQVVAFLTEKMAGGAAAQESLVDVDGMTPETLGSFFDAAALYYEQAPWKKVGERPIRIECDRFEGGPWYAVLMGQGGMTSGLALYDDLEMLTGIQDSDLSPEETAELNAALAVVFGSEEDLTDADREAAEEHNWRVAGPRAYPSVYRTDPGMQMRPPTPPELHRLEACLRAVPEFVRKKSRRVEPTTITVPTAVGEAAVGLAWVDW